MAIAPTGAIYKALKFDNVSSRTYGVYITGEAVYNAPERDVEMITIPGRNGSFALDNGRFQNIEVSYPAGIFADTEADFRQAISDFRNFLCSRNGYVRLQDEYNPDEYRMAVYKSGLEVDPAMMKAGEFTITFDCKPQRWLTSGETKQTIANSGNTLTNPTLFESGPLLEVGNYGYGNIQFNGYNIHIDSGALGDITLASDVKSSVVIDESAMNIGDTFTVNLDDVQYYILLEYSYDSQNKTNRTSDTITDSNSKFATSYNRLESFNDLSRLFYKTAVEPLEFTIGTDSAVTNSITGTINCISQRGTTSTVSVTITQSIKYTASTHTVEFERTTQSATSTATYVTHCSLVYYGYPRFISIIGHSTLSRLGDPTYIDCELGEAYMIKDGSIISLNQYIDLGSELPTLASGSNEFTFDNTITDLKVIPRWWKI